jgi:hypothetical protein
VRLVVAALALTCLRRPLVVDAQRGPLPTVGYLGTSDARTNAHNLDAFKQGLRELGFSACSNTIRTDRSRTSGATGSPSS